MRWLAVVGIGEDGLDGLGARAKRLIGAAEIVYGGQRHLELAAAAINGEARQWASPIQSSIDEITLLRGRAICVLASGDPFQFGVGATLARAIPAEDMEVVPAPSAFSLAAARLGWSLPEVALVSTHGRPMALVRPHLQPGAKVLVLTSDGEGPSALAHLLVESGFGASQLTVLEALGGPDERITTTRADAFARTDVAALNLCALVVAAGPGAGVIPRAPGLADSLFEHDGQITKRPVRALTIAALAPRRGELLWDIGAGSGSVGIEWMLADPTLRAVAIEADARRVERIRRNADGLGVPGLTIVRGCAPDALSDLSDPDAIFVGGGVTEPGVLDVAVERLRPGGRLVVNVVTLEGEDAVMRQYRERGGELLRIDLSRAEALGSMNGWQPARPITQWTWTKP
jgi:precorrin-6Y C5,15-methyltransferase (decarboxylating)